MSLSILKYEFFVISKSDKEITKYILIDAVNRHIVFHATMLHENMLHTYFYMEIILSLFFNTKFLYKQR